MTMYFNAGNFEYSEPSTEPRIITQIWINKAIFCTVLFRMYVNNFEEKPNIRPATTPITKESPKRAKTLLIPVAPPRLLF